MPPWAAANRIPGLIAERDVIGKCVLVPLGSIPEKIERLANRLFVVARVLKRSDDATDSSDRHIARDAGRRVGAEEKIDPGHARLSLISQPPGAVKRLLQWVLGDRLAKRPACISNRDQRLHRPGREVVGRSHHPIAELFLPLMADSEECRDECSGEPAADRYEDGLHSGERNPACLTRASAASAVFPETLGATIQRGGASP